MIGLVSTIRFGFAPLGIPNTGLGSSQNKTQGGLPQGAIRFGFRPRGTASSGVVATGSGVRHYQSGLPPGAVRFGFKPLGSPAAAASVVRHRAQYSGIELPKSKRKKKKQLVEITLALTAIERGADSATCRVGYEIPVAFLSAEHCGDVLVPFTMSIAYPLALNSRETGDDTAQMTTTYRSDEDEAMATLFNLMPFLGK
jgi:hypothetical protein